MASVTGNVVNGTIGKQMVDTLVENQGNVEVSTSCLLLLVMRRVCRYL